MWVKASISELTDSFTDDIAKGRYFAYHTRTRQVEELYYRTLYILFVADDSAVPHIFSGDPPNSFSKMWRAVNQAVLDGRGRLETAQGFYGDDPTVMNMLNDSAHASIRAIAISVGIGHSPELKPMIHRHVEHCKKLCVYLNYMEQMFRAGKDKSVVSGGVKNLHKPASAWQTVSPETKS
jgi:hypothetical protein